MSMRKKTVVCLVSIMGVVGLALLAGCDGGSDPNPVPTGEVQIMLVDAPADQIDELHLRFDSVEIVHRSAAVVQLLGPEDLPEDIDVISAGEDPVVLGTVDVPVGTYTWANLSIDPDSPVNRIVTEDGTFPLEYHAPRAESANLITQFRVRQGEQMTLLFDFAAAPSVRETPDGWVLTPQVHTRYVNRGIPFADLRGTVREVDGDPLTPPQDLVLGAFLRDQDAGELVQVAEVNPETGAFTMPTLVPGNYRLDLQFADAQWSRVGEPFVTNRLVRLAPNQETRITVDADL